MRTRKCRCLFVPPHVLESIARSGREDLRESARLTIQQSNLVRQRRLDTVRDRFSETLLVQQGLVQPAAAQAKRQVWNCQNRWEQRVPPPARGEGDPPTGEQDVDQMYDYTGIVRDYLQKVLNRNSYDNNGADLIGNVHHGVNYNNAFWDGDEFTAGDGDGVIFISLARSLDVIAHEIGHGIVQATANLDYYSQSGALNEHFADVFGTVITQNSEGQTAHDSDWLIGNEIMGPELYGEALRSMAAPGSAYDNSIWAKTLSRITWTGIILVQRITEGCILTVAFPTKPFTFSPWSGGRRWPLVSGITHCKTSGLRRISMTRWRSLQTQRGYWSRMGKCLGALPRQCEGRSKN
jgi:Zn-dependent metalloprotease